ncbi:MAG: hypothetical protein ABSE27_03695 [Acidobacteriaceae bacterium]|jgi:hypothetical protein
MGGFKPQGPEQHFALQRTTRAAETVTEATDAQRKSSEEARNTNERFYNNLALFSSGTIALSVTFMGYLKSQPKPLAHPPWLVVSWVCLMLCAACSLFWPFVYGYYSHYFHEWQTADVIQKKLKIEAKEYPTLAQGTHSLQTRAPISYSEIEDFRSNRLEAAGIYETRAKAAKRRETRYIHLWQWLGRIAQASFLIGLGFLLAFAIKNL